MSILISPTAATLQVRGTQQFSSTVSGSTNTGVSWLVNGIQGGNSTVGTVTSAGLYTAPAAIPSGGGVNVTARSNADATKSASATVSITSASTGVSVSISPTSATVAGGATQQFAATVSGATNTALTWVVNGISGGNSTYGTITSSGLYSAPACSSVSSVTVTAQSVADSSAKASSSVTLSTAAATNQRFVQTNGNDTNDGSACRPWATIQHAADAVNAGQTVIVGDGTYVETVSINHGGTASAPVVFKSLNKWDAKIKPTSTAANGNYTVSMSGVSYVTVQDFEITATPTTDSAVKFYLGSPNNAVVGNNIHDVGVSTSTCTSGAGVLIADNNEVVEGNWIWNIGPPRSVSFRCNQQHGIYVTSGVGGRLQNNVIFGIWQGLAFHLTGIGLSNWTIANNTLFDVGDSVHSDGGGFILDCLGGTCDNNTITNNIFYRMQNTTFYEVNDGGTVGSHNLYSNNLVNSSAGNTLVTGNPVNTVTGDPMFVNYTDNIAGDYHVQPGSPAVGAGTSTGAPATDVDGNARSTPETIGAYAK